MKRTIAIVGALAHLARAAWAQAPAPARVPAPAPVPKLERADVEAWLDGLVPYALRQGDIAGLVVSVVKDGQMVAERGYGWADVARRIPMDPQGSVVHVASISKTFTATAVMQLVEQGKLDLDADVDRYLDFAIPATFPQPITLRHLLTHTAGFEETPYKRYRPPLSLRDHVRMVPDRIYPPGTIPAYSNYGLSLAGYIVQRVSGERISDYVERHVIAPLGMTRSTFHMSVPAALQPFEAKSYERASSPAPYPPELVLEMAPVDAPALALATTAHDMTRYMLAHMREADADTGAPRLMRPATMRRMHADAFVPIPGTQPVALGLFRADYRGRRIIGHSGDGEGAHADMKLLPDERAGIFIAMNSDGALQGTFPASIALRLAILEQFVDRYFPAASPPQEPTAPTAREHARLAAGEYAWSRQETGDYREALGLLVRYIGLKPYIRANDDGTIETPALMTFGGAGRPQTWREVGPFVWREVGGDAHLRMDVRDGRVRSVWSDGTSSFWLNLRVPTPRSAALNIPLLLVSGLALLLTVLLWPVAAIVRRRYGRTLALAGRQGRAYRWTRLAALLGVLYLLGWFVALGADLASTVGAEPWIRLLQLLGLACVAGAGVALWNAWLTWRGARGGWARIWSVVLALALLDLAWFSFAFHLISLRMA